MGTQQIKVTAEAVLQAKQDFHDALDRFSTIANQFASDIEASSAAWTGPAQLAAVNTGITIHEDLGRVSTWGNTLMNLVGDHVSQAVENESQQQHAFNSLAGGTSQ